MPPAGVPGMPAAGVPGIPTAGVPGMPAAGVPGIPTAGVPSMPTENPASSPSSTGTSTAQQQLMQQMLQMFAGGGGGSATVRVPPERQRLSQNAGRIIQFLFLSLPRPQTRPRPQRCGSSPSWISSTPWASSTARPTCRPSSPPEETSMPLSRDCWAHSPLKDIQYSLTHTHTRIHTRPTRTHSHSFTENQEKSKCIVPNFTEEFRAGSGPSPSSFSVLRSFFFSSSPYFPLLFFFFFLPPSTSEQISVVERCRRAGLNHPHLPASVPPQRGARTPGCVFNLRFLHIKSRA